MSINKVEMQDSNGNIYYPHTDATVVKVGSNTLDAELGEVTDKANGAYTQNSKDNTTSFSEAASDTDIASGDKHSTIFGKILKSIKTLRSGKLNIANLANNLITTAAGLALDARQGKVLQDQITEQNNNLSKHGYLQLYVTTDENGKFTIDLSQFGFTASYSYALSIMALYSASYIFYIDTWTATNTVIVTRSINQSGNLVINTSFYIKVLVIGE